jgi:hypothetical protein
MFKVLLPIFKEGFDMQDASSHTNPFFFQSASDLDKEQIVQYYEEEGSPSESLSSKFNCYLIGERGAGKSMALLYHSFPVQRILKPDDNIRNIGVYVPCNHTLMLKNEPYLFEKYEQLAICEHFFVLAMAYSICNSLRDCCVLPANDAQKEQLDALSYALALKEKIIFTSDIFSSISMFSLRECNNSQRIINQIDSISLPTLYNFFTLILPILHIFGKITEVDDAHFSILLDDAHLLSEPQQKILNSYVSYRDHSRFSFKVAIASSEDYTFMTSDGSTLLDGHDYSQVNMEESFQTSKSSYGKFIRNIIQKRLNKIGIISNPDDFFPISPTMASEIQNAEDAVRRKAIAIYGCEQSKKVSDYVYKYGRAQYFQSRHDESKGKANLPQYSGIDTIAHVSTGVVRNALARCWDMFEIQKQKDKQIPAVITPAIQADVLQKASDEIWEKIRAGFSNVLEGCSNIDSQRIHNFFDQLGILFRNRLLSNSAEPRILAFIVSEKKFPTYQDVLRLLTLCRKAQLIYERYGPGKDDGRRETFYATNRLLWISRGLDPNGQHGRLSLKSSDIWAAANGKSFPFGEQRPEQGSLFSSSE